jgi:hypothetical protein
MVTPRGGNGNSTGELKTDGSRILNAKTIILHLISLEGNNVEK